MKIYSSILLLLILLMYLKPCTDKLQSKEIVELESVENTTNHQDSSFDGCSPFCSCSCCSIRVVSKNFQNSSSIPQNVAFEYPQRIISKPLNFSRSIWQPPQLV